MTVRELIAELSALDPDLLVYEPHPYHARQYEPRWRRDRPLAPTTLYLCRSQHDEWITDEDGMRIDMRHGVSPGEAFFAIIL